MIARVILETPTIAPADFEQKTGWILKPEGLCKDDRCVPLSVVFDGELDVGVLAKHLRMPLVHDETVGLWCLGPESGGRALTSVKAPDLILPDLQGDPFRLSSLRGYRVLLVAWASW